MLWPRRMARYVRRKHTIGGQRGGIARAGCAIDILCDAHSVTVLVHGIEEDLGDNIGCLCTSQVQLLVLVLGLLSRGNGISSIFRSPACLGKPDRLVTIAVRGSRLPESVHLVEKRRVRLSPHVEAEGSQSAR